MAVDLTILPAAASPREFTHQPLYGPVWGRLFNPYVLPRRTSSKLIALYNELAFVCVLDLCHVL
jgi:hypothetical protein